jgi:hypothetical protein
LRATHELKPTFRRQKRFKQVAHLPGLAKQQDTVAGGVPSLQKGLDDQHFSGLWVCPEVFDLENPAISASQGTSVDLCEPTSPFRFKFTRSGWLHTFLK